MRVLWRYGLDNGRRHDAAAGEQIVFCHFLYGCKAEAREERAVREIAEHYMAKAVFVPLRWLGELGGSSLTVPELPIMDANAGVEKAHEWVPARNLLLIAHAVALVRTTWLWARRSGPERTGGRGLP